MSAFFHGWFGLVEVEVGTSTCPKSFTTFPPTPPPPSLVAVDGPMPSTQLALPHHHHGRPQRHPSRLNERDRMRYKVGNLFTTFMHIKLISFFFHLLPYPNSSGLSPPMRDVGHTSSTPFNLWTTGQPPPSRLPQAISPTCS
jgi:hypothetical protein